MSERSEAVVMQSPRSGRQFQSLLDIIATIEQYSLCEKEAGNLSDETVTRVTLMHFIEVGARHGFVTSLPLLITAPFGFAVVRKVLPVFGKTSFSLTDQLFALLLSSLPALATFLFVAIMFSLLFQGNITRKCMKSLIQGLLLGKALGHFIVFAVLHVVYYLVLSKPSIYLYIYELHSKLKIISYKAAHNLIAFLYNLREPILEAAWYTVGLYLAACVIISTGYYYGRYRSAQLIQFKQRWFLE